MKSDSILWERLDLPGHDSARLSRVGGEWRLTGAALLSYDHRPCRLDYVVVCDESWRTRSAHVAGWFGDTEVAVELTTDGNQGWRLNGTEVPSARGCIDVDLAFTPATNLLSIRRLDLAVGADSPVRAAWLRFPELTLEPLDQIYRRVSQSTYRYESGGGRFTALLEVNPIGFVMDYEKIWRAVI